MLKKLDNVKLKDGRTAEIYRLIPPDDSLFCEKLKEFYQSYKDLSRRSIVSRLEGRYADVGNDYYYFAAIDGEIAGGLWFGYGKHEKAAANFGNVYVPEKYRGMGLTNILLPYYERDFAGSAATAAFCTCSREWIVKMYRAVGFDNISPGSPYLMAVNGGEKRSFPEVCDGYYRLSAPYRIADGSMNYRHEADCLGVFTQEFCRRGYISSRVANYQQALFLKEDGCGGLLDWLDGDGHLAGWCFYVTLAEKFSVFDFTCHRNLPEEELIGLLRKSLEQFPPEKPLVLSVFKTDEVKIRALKAVGFTESGELPGEVVLCR